MTNNEATEAAANNTGVAIYGPQAPERLAPSDPTADRREIVARAFCDDDIYPGAWDDEKKANEGSGRVWPNEKVSKYWHRAKVALAALDGGR